MLHLVNASFDRCLAAMLQKGMPGIRPLTEKDKKKLYADFIDVVEAEGGAFFDNSTEETLEWLLDSYTEEESK